MSLTLNNGETFCSRNLILTSFIVLTSFLKYLVTIFLLKLTPSSPLDNIWVIVIVWRLRGNIIRTALCWIVWQCSQSAAHLYEQFLQVKQTGFVTLGPYTVHRGSCLELYYCNMVEWLWWDSSQLRPTGFLQCFDTVGLLIWPVKSVPEMTYYVSSGTLNPAHSLTP